uniref:Fibronectin type-III domain-containing protein n=1 Tax=Callorhinchus milii TaxID=7868 RepID=A0A4W3K6U5_CALMI
MLNIASLPAKEAATSGSTIVTARDDGRNVTAINMFGQWRWLRLCLFLQLNIYFKAGGSSIENYAYIIPESPIVELGSELKASCILNDDYVKDVDANQIFWRLKDKQIPETQYVVVNRTVSNVTLTFSDAGTALLTCNLQLNEDQVATVFGTVVRTGLPPEKPKNLSCITYYDKNMTCAWDPGRNTFLRTSYLLQINRSAYYFFNKQVCLAKDMENFCVIPFANISYYVDQIFWVEATNGLGNAKSESIILDPVTVIKPDPPVISTVQSAPNITTMLTVRWKNPAILANYQLKYIIRYRAVDDHEWMQVPPEDTSNHRESFMLHNLTPFTEYVFTIRCKSKREAGFWSDWSAEKSGRTPEGKPLRGPSIWRTIEIINSQDRRLHLMWKELTKSNANGIILWYYLEIKQMNPLEIEEIKTLDLFYDIILSNKGYEISVKAHNSVGNSSAQTIKVLAKNQKGFAGVQKLSAYPQDGQLMVEWKRVSSSGFLIEWCEELKKDLYPGPVYWQHESRSANKTFLKENIMPFKRYQITIYPLYNGQPGASLSTKAYLEQGRPIRGPEVHLKRVGKNEVEMMWKEIAVNDQQGFITNYTIFYKHGNANVSSVTVDPMHQECTLTSLKGNTLYVIWVMASTVKGGRNSSEVTFTTLHFAKGEIEAIVVPVCLGFLFITIMTILLCYSKKHLIKKYVWPNVADPANSRVVDWLPNAGNLMQNNVGQKEPLNPDGIISDLKIIEADVGSTKYLSTEEDMKPITTLKKEKSMSGEHSSGIGGSSCMSSPRQSVSDSDDGESVQNTSSTVQYSTVASDPCYKRQVPPQGITRSESTQPLLENEEEHMYGNLGSCSTEMKRQYFKQNGNIEEANEGSEAHINKSDVPTHLNGGSLLGLNELSISDQSPDFVGCHPRMEEFPSNNEQTVVRLDFLGFNADLEPDHKSYMPQAVKHNSYMPQSK